MLESDHRVRKITSHGVEFAGRCYMPENGVGRIGLEVSVRWMPHHTHEIDLYTFLGNRYLGRAFLSSEASEELRARVLSESNCQILWIGGLFMPRRARVVRRGGRVRSGLRRGRGRRGGVRSRPASGPGLIQRA